MDTALRLCKAMNRLTGSEETGRLHGFFQESQIVPPSIMAGGHQGGTLYFPVALVEFADGHLETVSTYNVTMLHDGEELEREKKRDPVDYEHLF